MHEKFRVLILSAKNTSWLRIDYIDSNGPAVIGYGRVGSRIMTDRSEKDRQEEFTAYRSTSLFPYERCTGLSLSLRQPQSKPNPFRLSSCT